MMMAVTSKDKERQIETGIWKLVDGRFYAEIRPEGKGGKTRTKKLAKLSDLKTWVTKTKANSLMGDKFQPIVKDKRRLSDLVNEWDKLYGHTLKDKERHSVLLATCKLLNDPIAQTFTQEDFILFRKARMETVQPGKFGKTISPNTINHSHAYLSAVFNRLIQLGKWRYPNPLAGLKKLKVDDPGLVYLDENQIEQLLSALQYAKNPDFLIITKICLSIGARWGEAATLRAENIKNRLIQLTNTKSGKSRALPISAELEQEILSGRPSSGRLFADCSPKAGFSNALKRAGITLPDGQMTHVLRHTFASHYMINDGNILKLKEILGHASLEMTMRYAHLAPKHLTQALTHNPLASIAAKKLSKVGT
jgi:integrase